MTHEKKRYKSGLNTRVKDNVCVCGGERERARESESESERERARERERNMVREKEQIAVLLNDSYSERKF
jgi:hypothetical protein